MSVPCGTCKSRGFSSPAAKIVGGTAMCMDCYMGRHKCAIKLSNIRLVPRVSKQRIHVSSDQAQPYLKSLEMHCTFCGMERDKGQTYCHRCKDGVRAICAAKSALRKWVQSGFKDDRLLQNGMAIIRRMQLTPEDFARY